MLSALGQPADESVGVGQFGRGDALFVPGVQAAVADVVITVPVKRLVSWRTMPRERRRSAS